MVSDSARLRRSRALRALAASGDAYWEHDLRSDALWFSSQFHEMLGFGPETAPTDTTTSRARIHPDDLPRYVADHEAAVAHMGRFTYEMRYLDAEGRWRWLRGRCRVLPDAAGVPAWITGVVSEVQAQKAQELERDEHRRRLEASVRERTASLEAALQLAESRRREAEHANQAKSRFLAHMSHEIRTPLNGVLGLTELALRAATSPEQQRFLTTAHESGQSLLQLINDVLDLSRIESGRVELRTRRFDPSQLVADAMRSVLPLARRRDLLTIFDWHGDTPWVEGDDGAIRQIVVNLLGNAIKFTEEGRIALETWLSAADSGRCRLMIRISDTGPGVPPERRAAIFEPFVQGDETLARAHAGAGLGLAIARRLADSMRGRLTLECPDSGGAVFTFEVELPVVEVPEAHRLPEPPPPGLVWLVYQRAPGGRWMSAQLQRLGWRTEVHYGLSVALDKARDAATALPDAVVITEQALQPDSDLAALRAAFPRACLHLLVRPDWNAPEIAEQVDRVRAAVMVAPPVPAQLRRLGVPPERTPAVVNERTAVREDAEVLLVEDNEVNQLLGREFLSALGLRVRLAIDGHEAVRACLERTPALVLMDLQMPRMDGLQATRRLRAMQQAGTWTGCPIVVLTAHVGPEDRQACYAAGADGLLTKPLVLDTLRETLARWIPMRSAKGSV
ncbi:MAG TPA: ATP-binding protein [Burkholderiaceae bacterium]|nr:ATP-binding protein [Burkholderiaceae bacterium]